MIALLIMDNRNIANLRVLVSLSEKALKHRVISLLEQDRGREAFEILKSRAEVKEYVPVGRKPRIKPEVTLFEDML
ncbi:MAG: hypothetical protein JW847_02965 [Candidatus Omnitrophica bacterium]|nr:hypothetical protein [Candidatus Omnitrophota bacterium]